MLGNHTIAITPFLTSHPGGYSSEPIAYNYNLYAAGIHSSTNKVFPCVYHRPEVNKQQKQKTSMSAPKYRQASSQTTQIRRESCAKRFCSGICNFFGRLTRSSGGDQHQCLTASSSNPRSSHNTTRESSFLHSVPPQQPNICFQSFQIPSQQHPPQVELNLESLTALRAYAFNNGDDKTANPESGEEDGDYIIYIPRVSRTKLERNYLEPLRNGSYEPVAIQSRSKESRNSDAASHEDSFVKLHRALEPKLKRSLPNINVNVAEEENSEGDSSDERKRPKSVIIAGDNSYGDFENPDDDLNLNKNVEDVVEYKKSKGMRGVKTVTSEQYFYVPMATPSSSFSSALEQDKNFTFKKHDKKIGWLKIRERHIKSARNKEHLEQNRKVQWETFFSIWSRRRLIADMKKKLNDDCENKYLRACSAPDLLENRFHHIHWLANTGKQNNSVGRYFDKEENTVVALKIFGDKPFATPIENLDNKLMAIREINSLKRMNHKNIVKLLGYFELHDKYHVILESCDHSLREDITEAPSGLGTCASKKIIKYILNGLNFCHQINCLHRDLCPENILVCKSGLIKIADFDRSVFLSDDGVGMACPTPGSFVYNSPEILAGDREYGLPSDVWSLGIIFCELLTGQTPWKGRNAQAQLREIHNCVGPLLPRHASVAKLSSPIEDTNVASSDSSLHNHAQLQQIFATISNSCTSFIKKCLDVNPQCRYTCRELLHHQFIKGSYK